MSARRHSLRGLETTQPSQFVERVLLAALLGVIHTIEHVEWLLAVF